MESRWRRFMVFPQSKVRRDTVRYCTVRYGTVRGNGSDLSEDVLGLQNISTVL